eukprot:g25414.t1
MLAIGWYTHTPLPDVTQEARAAVPTELSRRLCSVFDAGDYCDVHFNVGTGPASTSIGAHRIVLRRNPALGMEEKAARTCISLPELSPDVVRQILRAHYLEAGRKSW